MKKVSLWERYLTKEIGIEFKAALYFFSFLLFYCCYRLYLGQSEASILHMAEMIFTAYIIGYLQVYLLWNFDEADALGPKEFFGMLLCTTLYTILSYACAWFDKNVYVSVGFFAYVVFVYICVFMIYKYKRKIDDKLLNQDLELFKTRQQKNPGTKLDN